MTQPSSPQLEDRETQLALAPPFAPRGVDVRMGVRWVQVIWQPPADNAPVEDYLLAVSPGSQTIRFDAATTQTVLIALAPGRSYTVFVAARNDAGSSGWISSRPFALSYAVAGEPAGHALLNADLFEDLLLLDDEALRAWLSTADEADLGLALASTPHPQRLRVLDCIEPADRADRLRQQFAPPPPKPQTAIVLHREIVQPPRLPKQPIVPEPEIVIEIPPPARSRRRPPLWLAVLLPVLILAMVLIAVLPRWLPQPADTPLQGTVEALVAARMTAESVPLLVREIVVTPSPQPTAPPSPTMERSAEIYARSTVELLNVRSGPGEIYPIRQTLPAGVQVALLGRTDEGDWVYISAGQVEGWVASWLLMTGDDLQTLAVRSVPPTPTVTATMPAENAIVVQPTSTAADLPILAVTVTAEPTPIPVEPPPAETVAAQLVDSPCLMGGYFWLIHPIEITVYNQVTFHWGFSTPLPPQCGFEVRIWRDGDSPRGVHDAVFDNKNGAIKSINGNEYQLDIPFLYELPGVTGTGHYWWTVAIVQIEPTYRHFERQADPSRFYVDVMR